MRALAFLAIIILILLIVWVVMKIVEARSSNKKVEQAHWRAVARNTENGLGREIWIACPGEDEFLFRSFRRMPSTDQWEDAWLDAELEVERQNNMKRKATST